MKTTTEANAAPARLPSLLTSPVLLDAGEAWPAYRAILARVETPEPGDERQLALLMAALRLCAADVRRHVQALADLAECQNLIANAKARFAQLVEARKAGTAARTGVGGVELETRADYETRRNAELAEMSLCQSAESDFSADLSYLRREHWQLLGLPTPPKLAMRFPAKRSWPSLEAAVAAAPCVNLMRPGREIVE